MQTMYMSYCRYEGTHQELRVCLGDADEHIMEAAEYPVSEHEVEHFRQMVMDFFGWLEDNELLTEYAELDEDQLDEICDFMRKSYQEGDDDE